METLISGTDAADGMAAGQAHPHRSRRLRRVTLLAAGLALVLALTGYLYVAHTYTLEPGPTWNFLGSTECHAGSITEHRYPWRSGESVKFAVSFGNRGSNVVTVTNVRLDPYGHARERMGVVGLKMSLSGRDELSEMPFRPVALKPDDYFVARVELRMPDSMSEGSRTYFDKLLLDYTVLGIKRSEYVSMGTYVGIQNRQPPNCQ